MINQSFRTQKVAFITDVESLTGYHRSTLRRKWKKGIFPKPVLIDGSRLAWSPESIDEWIHSKLQGE